MNVSMRKAIRIAAINSNSWRGGFKYLFVLALFALLVAMFKDWAYDDPFITFRFARNLSNGVGFVYNPGQRVLSTTTPLFTLLLALGSFIWSDIPHLAVVIGAVSLLMGGLFLFSLSETWNRPWIDWAGLVLFPTFPLLVSTLGSEIPLYLALCLGAYAYYFRRQYTAAAGLSALASLARPDGVLVPAILGVDYFFRGGRDIPWKSVLLFAGILFPWLLFSWVYFGSPVPATLAAKQHQGSMAISESFSQGFFTIVSPYRAWPYYLAALCGCIGLVYSFLRRHEILTFLVWPALYFAAYSWLHVSRYFWYYAPLVPGYVVAVGAGLSGIADMTQVNKISKRLSHLLKYLPIGLILIFLLAQVSFLARMYRNPDERYAAYRAAGEWINSHTLPEDQVGALEVGIIGYYAERPMIDFAGLLQPGVARVLNSQTTYQESALWAVREFQPGYILLHSGLFPVLESELKDKGCELMKIIKGSDYQYRWDLKIYHCP